MPPSPTPETARQLHERGKSVGQISYRLKITEHAARQLLVQAGVLQDDAAERARQQQLDLAMRRATLRQVAVWNRQRAARMWA
jgi:hypothetical protein